MSDANTTGASDNPEVNDKPAASAQVFSDRLRHRLRNIGAAIASVAAIGAVIGGLTGYWNAWKVINNDLFQSRSHSETKLTFSKGPSVAALPISNPEKVTALDPIAETMAQQLVSSLGKFGLLRVTPRATAATLARYDDTIETARKAGVDYLVTGEVRAFGDGARANVVVADVRSGAEIWSKSFDANAEGIRTSAGAYEIADTAAALISSAIDQGEYKKIQNKPVGELTSYECIIQSRVGGWVGSQSAGLKGLACSKRLTESEPNNALAWSARANVLDVQRFLGFGLATDAAQHFDKRTYLNEEIMHAATRAVDLAPDDADVRRTFAVAIGTNCQVDLFRQQFQKAVALNPNDPYTLGELGSYLAYMGDWDDGSAAAERAIRLAGSNASYIWWLGPAKRHWWRGEYKPALDDFLHAYLEGFWLSHLDQAYTLPFLGRLDDAKAQVAKLVKLWPEFTIREADALYRMYCFQPEYIERMNGALRQAGLPE
jgi:TolB-like protein